MRRGERAARAQAGRIVDRKHAVGEHGYYVSQMPTSDGVFYFAVRSGHEQMVRWSERCSRVAARILGGGE